MRTCSKCGETKPLSEYYKQPSCKGGRRPSCKACDKARVKANRDANLDEHRKRDHERYVNNPARQEAQKRTSRAHYAANVEHHVANRAAYYATHRNDWYAYRARRKKRLANAFIADVSFDDILQRDLGLCGICGEAIYDAIELDHIHPLAAGGTHEPKNVQLAHRSCNRRKWATAA